ncbi:acyltransferase [Pedobacter gandavensis]|uniref:acyltransferase n=1 Tax=Pedobacter gandavensis TaxID=2679963 RepID=UPI002930EF3B|nr:acyltransferase [Pedobacter gandavensis]
MTITSRSPWIDYLRGFITLLVVAHHSSLAYTTFAYFNRSAYISSTHPIVDRVRWKGMDYFEDFNDIFFMSLMFLIAGIFVWSSLQKKGTKLFLKDRFYRLMVPFFTGVTLLMLIAHYPAYHLTHGNWSLRNYIIDFFTIESWPVGPPWFLWVLFSFNLIFSVSLPFWTVLIKKAGQKIKDLNDKPIITLLIWYLLTWISYVPFMFWFSPGSWTGTGPFDFQTSRILLYFSYFLLGTVLGSLGTDLGVFSSKSVWIRKWPLWISACILTYVLLKMTESPLTKWHEQKVLSRTTATLIYRSIWVLSCSLSSIALISLFKQTFHRTNRYWQSLADNAYGIYLIHYVFVIWCQFLLLELELSALWKFILTFLVSITASWGITVLIRKQKIIKRYL